MAGVSDNADSAGGAGNNKLPGKSELLTSGWYSLWTQHTLFTCYFFLPIMIGVYCSYIMHEEEVNRNWNKTLALPQKRMDVFLSKLIISCP